MTTRRGWMLAAFVAVCASACVSYDSRWLQHEEEKKRAAQRLKPATLGAERGRLAGTRTALVRAYATRAYAAETVRWERQFDALLDDANRVLQPAIGLRLENGGTSLWAPEAESAPMTAIGELSKHDPGEGVHWVVGLLQSVSKDVTDFDKLGAGSYFSKYLVVRGSADAADMDYIGKHHGVSETENQEIYSKRRHHKIVTVFLHEIGHTLGAAHRTARDTIMSPHYDPSQIGFDDPTLGVLRITLPHHLEGVPQSAASSLAAYLEKSERGWVTAERESWLTRLRRHAPAPEPASKPPAPQAVAPAPAASPLPLETLSPADREKHASALRSEKAGDTSGAWTTAQPLFEAYPRVLEVQELRCRLAKAKRLFPVVVDAHCARHSELTQIAAPDESQ